MLDTNVVLHDASCIYNFQENDIVVPITVIEELDQFKRGHGDLNFQAREFLRSLDALTGALLSEEGARLGDQRGTIRVVLGHELHEAIRATFVRDAPDHRILSTALHLKEQNAGRPVVVVSKDTNLRMKAKAIGLCAQDYRWDKVESFDKLYTGKRLVTASSELIDRIYGNGEYTPQVQVPEIERPTANRTIQRLINPASDLHTHAETSSRLHAFSKVAG